MDARKHLRSSYSEKERLIELKETSHIKAELLHKSILETRGHVNQHAETLADKKKLLAQRIEQRDRVKADLEAKKEELERLL